MHVAAKLIHFLEPSPEEEYFPFLPVFLWCCVWKRWWDRRTDSGHYICIHNSTARKMNL
jgi:hypothetical protein